MEVSTQDRARFRGTRQLVGNLVVTVAGLLLFVDLGISIILAPPSTGSSGKWGGVAVSVVGVLAMGALLLRMRTAFTVELAPETPMYRTLLRNVEFNRSEVVGIGLKDRDRGMAKISQPYLDMRDGQKVWLADMGQGKLITPASIMQADLVRAVDHWIQ